jgi:hypothetical protein
MEELRSIIAGKRQDEVLTCVEYGAAGKLD